VSQDLLGLWAEVCGQRDRLQAENAQLREVLHDLEQWVSGYAQDHVPNEKFHVTGGFAVMERARAALSGIPKGGTE
jgi:hypothetical protein